MADFDWAWPKALDRAAVERVLGLGFLEDGSNVILAGAQGLGETMLARNGAPQGVPQGPSVRCVTPAELLLDLGGQETSRALERRLRAAVKPRLLAIDELGDLTYDNRAADLLFQVIRRRHWGAPAAPAPGGIAAAEPPLGAEHRARYLR